MTASPPRRPHFPTETSPSPLATRETAAAAAQRAQLLEQLALGIAAVTTRTPPASKQAGPREHGARASLPPPPRRFDLAEALGARRRGLALPLCAAGEELRAACISKLDACQTAAASCTVLLVFARRSSRSAACAVSCSRARNACSSRSPPAPARAWRSARLPAPRAREPRDVLEAAPDWAASASAGNDVTPLDQPLEPRPARASPARAPGALPPPSSTRPAHARSSVRETSARSPSEVASQLSAGVRRRLERAQLAPRPRPRSRTADA